MKTKGVLKLTFVVPLFILLSFSGCGYAKPKVENNNHASDEISEKSDKGRSEYLSRLHAKTTESAMDKISRGQYTEAIDIAEKGIAQLKDSDYEYLPAMVGSFYYILGNVAGLARIELWIKEATAYEKALETLKPKSDYPAIASSRYSSLARAYDNMGAHKEAEENYANAIVFADMIKPVDGRVPSHVVRTRKDFLIFCKDHGKEKKARELMEELKDLTDGEYLPSDDEIREEFGEHAESMLEYKRGLQDEWINLLKEERREMESNL